MKEDDPYASLRESDQAYAEGVRDGMEKAKMNPSQRAVLVEVEAFLKHLASRDFDEELQGDETKAAELLAKVRTIGQVPALGEQPGPAFRACPKCGAWLNWDVTDEMHAQGDPIRGVGCSGRERKAEGECDEWKKRALTHLRDWRTTRQHLASLAKVARAYLDETDSLIHCVYCPGTAVSVEWETGDFLCSVHAKEEMSEPMHRAAYDALTATLAVFEADTLGIGKILEDHGLHPRGRCTCGGGGSGGTCAWCKQVAAEELEELDDQNTCMAEDENEIPICGKKITFWDGEWGFCDEHRPK